MKSLIQKSFFIFGGLFLSVVAMHQAEAKVFRNSYISFEMPDTWDCKLEHTEWVCRSLNQKEAREAIIILTAKEVGPTDSFTAYTTHLNTPQKVTTRAGAQMTSRVVYAPKQVQINQQVWIDGLHQGSEVANYFTRYLATIKDQIAILVTLSAHKDHYTKYSQDFYKTVMSLRVLATKNLLSQPESGPLRPGGELLAGSIIGAIPSEFEEGGLSEGSGGGAGAGSDTQNLLIGLAVILAAGAGYVLLKTKKS
jgi:hypothetical protein